MLITFTTEHGQLVIRSEDLRRIEDRAREGCRIAWVEGDELMISGILGTAQENHDRIVMEEARAIAAYEDMQQRSRQGLPALPVSRGRR